MAKGNTCDGYEIQDVDGIPVTLAWVGSMGLAQRELVRLRRNHPGRTLRIVDQIDPGRDCEPDPEYDAEVWT